MQGMQPKLFQHIPSASSLFLNVGRIWWCKFLKSYGKINARIGDGWMHLKVLTKKSSLSLSLSLYIYIYIFASVAERDSSLNQAGWFLFSLLNLKGMKRNPVFHLEVARLEFVMIQPFSLAVWQMILFPYA